MWWCMSLSSNDLSLLTPVTSRYVTERPGRLCRIYAFREKDDNGHDDDDDDGGGGGEGDRQHEEAKRSGDDAYGSDTSRSRHGTVSRLVLAHPLLPS